MDVSRPSDGPFGSSELRAVEEGDEDGDEEEYEGYEGELYPHNARKPYSVSPISTMSLIITAPPTGPPSYAIRGDLATCRVSFISQNSNMHVIYMCVAVCRSRVLAILDWTAEL